EILRTIHITNKAICGERDWWFLQEVGHFRFQGFASGVDADVVGATRKVTYNDGTPLNSTFSRPAKGTIGDAGDERSTDNLRIEIDSGVSAGTILNTWLRGDLTEQDWVIGHDEYELADDV